MLLTKYLKQNHTDSIPGFHIKVLQPNINLGDLLSETLTDRTSDIRETVLCYHPSQTFSECNFNGGAFKKQVKSLKNMLSSLFPQVIINENVPIVNKSDRVEALNYHFITSCDMFENVSVPTVKGNTTQHNTELTSTSPDP